MITARKPNETQLTLIEFDSVRNLSQEFIEEGALPTKLPLRIAMSGQEDLILKNGKRILVIPRQDYDEYSAILNESGATIPQLYTSEDSPTGAVALEIERTSKTLDQVYYSSHADNGKLLSRVFGDTGSLIKRIGDDSLVHPGEDSMMFGRVLSIRSLGTTTFLPPIEFVKVDTELSLEQSRISLQSRVLGQLKDRPIAAKDPEVSLGMLYYNAFTNGLRGNE